MGATLCSLENKVENKRGNELSEMQFAFPLLSPVLRERGNAAPGRCLIFWVFDIHIL